jgi:hypothetical protein
MTETETATAPVKAGTPNLNKALSLLQGELPRVTKTKTGKVEGENKAGKYFSYEYSYADLGDVVADVGPLLAKYGLAFHCGPTINPAERREMILVWSLLHESGEEKTGEWPLGPTSQKPQSLGSAITYGRRYCFTAATNIVLEDDDDGQRAQQDHGSRQSAGDVWDNAAPARPANGNGQQRGQVSRPAQPPRPAAAETAPEDIDKDAQAYADEAHGAVTPHDIEDIHQRARVAGKLAALVRNPAGDGNGKPGKLAVYLDWKRRQIKEADDALADLTAAAAERDVSDLDGYLKAVVGTGMETATPAQLRAAAKTLREKAPAAT